MIINFGKVPVTFSWSSILLLVLVALVAYWYVKKYWKHATKAEYIKVSIILAVVGTLTVVVHEIAHALVAFAFNDPIVSASLGFPISYVATEIPVTEVPPIQELLIVLAGPAATWLIGGIAAYFVWKWPESLKENAVQFIAYLNINMGRINLFPIFLLDGGKALDALMRMSIQPLFHMSDDTRLLIGSIVSVAFITFWVLRDYITGKKHIALEDKLASL